MIALIAQQSDPLQSYHASEPEIGATEGHRTSIPYRLQWKRQLPTSTGLVPAGAAAEDGTLWAITQARTREPVLTRIDALGTSIESYALQVPLRLDEWVGYRSPAASGERVGLLTSVASGGQIQTFEGAFFTPIHPNGAGIPVRVSRRGPQFPTLVGAEAGKFVAAGDQQPLTLLKLDSTGKVLWRRYFSTKLVLPELAIGQSGTIFMVSEGGDYLQVHKIDSFGNVIQSTRISAKQGTVSANDSGGCSVLLSRGNGGKDNAVSLLTLDYRLRQVGEVQTPLCGRGGRTYSVVTTPRGHMIIGEAPEAPSTGQPPRKILAEFDNAGRLVWQASIPSLATPLLAPFRGGFYIVWDAWHPKQVLTSMNIEKYLY